MAQWKLFVDESGTVGTPSQEFVVVGVLLNQEIPCLQTRTPNTDEPDPLGERVRGWLPWVPWPLHATDLNLPIACLAWHEYSQTSNTIPSVPETLETQGTTIACQQRLESAAGFLREHHAHALRDAVEVAKTGHISNRQPLACLERLLSRPELRGLRNIATAYRQRFWDGLATLFQEAAQVQEHSVLLVSSGESCRGESLKRPEGRYMDLLEALLERTLHFLLAAHPGEHQIVVCPSGINIPTGPLNPQNIDHVIQRVIHKVGAGPEPFQALTPQGRVHFAGQGISSMNEQTPGGTILADFMANRMLKLLRRNPCYLRDLESDAVRTLTGTLSLSCRIPGEDGSPGWSSLTTGGALNDLIRNSRRRSNPRVYFLQSLAMNGHDLFTSRPREWSVEQAMEWVL